MSRLVSNSFCSYAAAAAAALTVSPSTDIGTCLVAEKKSVGARLPVCVCVRANECLRL